MSDRNYYKTPEHIRWRRDIFKRDKGRCQYPGCGTRKKLQAHHIKKISSYPALKQDLTNGISLCSYHHKQTFGCEERFEELFTNIVRGFKRNAEISRMRYTGKMNKDIL